MKCAYHPDREPIGSCVECGRLVCMECKALLGGKIYCTYCADEKFVYKGSESGGIPATTDSKATNTLTPIESLIKEKTQQPAQERAKENTTAVPTVKNKTKKRNRGLVIFLIILGILIAIITITYVILTSMGYRIEVSF